MEKGLAPRGQLATQARLKRVVSKLTLRFSIDWLSIHPPLQLFHDA